MKRLIVTILTTALLVAIVATPYYRVNSPKFSASFSVLGNQNNNTVISTQ